jgi:dimethylargininase
MGIALTREPSPRLAEGEVTFIARSPLDFQCALIQHRAYCDLLQACGVQVRVLPCLDALPDSVFVEDTAVVLDEVAVLCSLGAASRRAESAHIRAVLAEYRPVIEIPDPARIEGGDVLRIGRTLLVGLSTRTNAEGVSALAAVVALHGYHVIPVEVRGCLHFKTGCTALDDHTLLVNPDWIDADALHDFELVPVPASEPWAANVLRIGDHLIAQSATPRTADLLAARGHAVHLADISEFAKVEAGLTCMSLVFSGP